MVNCVVGLSKLPLDFQSDTSWALNVFNHLFTWLGQTIGEVYGVPLWCPLFTSIGDKLAVHMNKWWLKSSWNVVIQVQKLVKFPIRSENEGDCIDYEYKPWIMFMKWMVNDSWLWLPTWL